MFDTLKIYSPIQKLSVVVTTTFQRFFFDKKKTFRHVQNGIHALLTKKNLLKNDFGLQGKANADMHQKVIQMARKHLFVTWQGNYEKVGQSVHVC